MSSETILNAVVLCLVVIVSIGIHEWAHAIVADLLGDPTPRSQGRVTINPLAHIDPIGTVLIPFMIALFPSGFGLIGWGKPVMVDVSYFKNRVRDHLLVTAAGPVSNLILGLIVSVVGGFVLKSIGNPDAQLRFFELVQTFIQLNVVLAVFNMIPIPPLDGSHFLKYLINMSDETYMNLSRWGFFILIVFINTPLVMIVGKAAQFISRPFYHILLSIVN
jgi:Zn-dependent protease